MSKAFYISIPYSTAAMEVKKSFAGNLLSGFSQKAARQMADRFEENKVQLQQRADIVSQGLARVGVRVAPLNTEELIELFYELFNPGEKEKGGVKIEKIKFMDILNNLLGKKTRRANGKFSPLFPAKFTKREY